jgi:N-acetyl-anhydromuramyl-L-alanine amidase AmpD
LIWAVLPAAVWLAGCQNICLVPDVPAPPLNTRVASSSTYVPPVKQTWTPPASASWIPTVTERSWRFIIVHHSASPTGSAAMFDREHRDRGWDELGYHFVIGNGTLTGEGQVEIGPRWVKQKHGAHTKVRGHDEYNELGIGICLVGNLSQTQATEAQMRSLATLIRWLMARYNIPKTRVLGHGMLAPTECPGKQFSFPDLYRRL